MKRKAAADPGRVPGAQPGGDLREEIDMLRGLIQRVVSLAEGGRELEELLGILEKVGRASTRLATLLKTQQTLQNQDDLFDVLNQVIDEVLLEKRADLERKAEQKRL
ncbi:hypothetical protein ADN00_13910 [Ornatilinea apprima]|uniref:Uncharacterized protein n=1 Tax=Ornatilinea apprima TaxID=1134406 RepID=A0A0P6X2Z5_9CHLR|nr:hypothetical protein [Ornatilinea apprima]KPL74097.1 hypothetical protein ADN00_13910 [Ornatilinea apprima]